MEHLKDYVENLKAGGIKVCEEVSEMALKQKHSLQVGRSLRLLPCDPHGSIFK